MIQFLIISVFLVTMFSVLVCGETVKDLTSEDKERALADLALLDQKQALERESAASVNLTIPQVLIDQEAEKTTELKEIKIGEIAAQVIGFGVGVLILSWLRKLWKKKNNACKKE